MVGHLWEIQDAAARDGVEAFQKHMEVLVASLLHENAELAAVQIEQVRILSLNHVMSLKFASRSADHQQKARRIAVAMLEESFDRILAAIGSPGGSKPGQPS